MTTKIQKWGNSLAIRLPKNIVDQSNLKEGSEITIIPSNKDIRIKPLLRKNPSLKDLVEGITDNNRHKEISFGKRVGKETW
jgi:antitoxin MazE